MTHPLKTRVARLALGVLIAGSSTLGFIGTDMGVASAADTAVIDEISFTPQPGKTIGYGQVFVRGIAPVGNKGVRVHFDGPGGRVTNWLDTDAAGRFVHHSTILPASWCGKKISVYVVNPHVWGGASWTADNMKYSDPLHCGPRLGYTQASPAAPGGAKFTGKYFTPGAKVTLLWMTSQGKYADQTQTTASSAGTITGTAKCYTATGMPKLWVYAWDQSALVGSQVMKLVSGRCVI